MTAILTVIICSCGSQDYFKKRYRIETNNHQYWTDSIDYDQGCITFVDDFYGANTELTTICGSYTVYDKNK